MSHFEIFILNYNGSRFLEPCVSSLVEMNSFEHRVGINIVDNGSSDNSKEIVSKMPTVNYLDLGANYGFSRGNNFGVERRIAQLGQLPDFIMFLNNDTKVDKNLLNSIDRTFKENPKAGVVGVKSLFMDDYIPLSFDFEQEYIDVNISGDNLGRDFARYRAFKAFKISENAWRIKKGGCLFLPVADSSKGANLNIVSSSNVKISILEKFFRQNNNFEKLLSANQFESHVLADSYVKLIQNAGSFVTERLEAGDMGSYEIDTGQYDSDREVNAVCGVAMTLRADLFKILKGFDPHFFAYYEDTDLSLRARRLGYQCYYSGQALIHHVHAGSSGVATDYFRFNVNYSRLYFLSKHASWNLFVKRLFEIKDMSKGEFENYLLDGIIENKSNLRTYAKFIKYNALFLLNRLQRLFFMKKDRDLSASYMKEKYVNEF